MKKLHLLLAAVLVLAQIPFTAFAARHDTGPVQVSEAVLNEVWGGVCTSCHSEPDEPDDDDDHPERVGRAYWEHTATRTVGHSQPTPELEFEYQNNTNRSVTRTVTTTITDSFSWSLGGGVPRGIVSASLGSSYGNTSTDTFTASIAPYMTYRVYSSNPSTRYRYTFVQFQDWSDGSRQQLASGSANGTRVSTLIRTSSTPIN